MSLGILDIPGVALGLVDHALAVMAIPAIVRVVLWGAVSGYASMWIYRRHSPQQRIADVRTELAAVQARLAGYDGEFSGLMPLIGQQFRLALRQMRLTAGAALMAALPMLLILPWLSNQYDVRDPEPATAIRVCAEPVETASHLHWVPGADTTDTPACQLVVWPARGATVTLQEDAQALLTLPLPAPAAIIHKRHWLNFLVGNPAGYLADHAKASAIRLDMPKVNLINWGPSWIRGWEASFFVSALICSLWLRWRWKLN